MANESSNRYIAAYKYVFGITPAMPASEELCNWCETATTIDLVASMSRLAKKGAQRPSMAQVEWVFISMADEHDRNTNAGEMPHRGCARCHDDRLTYDLYYGAGYVPAMVFEDSLRVLHKPVAADQVYILAFPCDCDLGDWFNNRFMKKPLEKSHIIRCMDVFQLHPNGLLEFQRDCSKLWSRKLEAMV